jgi:hypothetical protein
MIIVPKDDLRECCKLAASRRRANRRGIIVGSDDRR